MTAREYDLIVIGAGTVGENVADYAKKGGLSGRAGRGRAGGRRVLLLGVHAVEGTAAGRERAASGAGGRRGGAGGDRRRGSGGGFRAPRRDRARLGRRVAGGVGRVDRHRPGARARPVHRRARPSRSRPPTAPPSSCAPSTPWRSAPAASRCCPTSPASPRSSHGPATTPPARRRRPSSLAILGGGVVACEMATAYASFGTKVTMIVRGETLLPGQEPFASEAVADASRRGRGDDPHRASRSSRPTAPTATRCSTSATAARWSPSRCWWRPAASRAPWISGSATIGLTDGDWLDVDDTMLVKGYDWLYGVGDVNHRALLTHQGKYQARAAGDVIAARARGDRVAGCDVGPACGQCGRAGGSAGDLHRPGGRIGGSHRRGGREDRAQHPGHRLRPVVAGRLDRLCRRLPGPGAGDRRRGEAGAARRHVRRPGCQRDAAGRDDRRGRPRCRSRDSGTRCRPTRP